MRPRRLAVALLVPGILAACGTGGGQEGRVSITIAAASDLRPAFEELGDTFSDETGIEVRFSFGSSGQLREQVVNGAPFDLYASADAAYVDAVIEAGRGDPATRLDYAVGRLALWSPSGTPPSQVGDLADRSHRVIAVANPAHAPYGAAAVQALGAAGVLDEVDERLVYGESIGDTFRIAASGNADVALVALSLAIADGRPHTLVPAELHDPIRQTLVVTGAGARAEAARAFVAHLVSHEGRRVMAAYGFEAPAGATDG